MVNSRQNIRDQLDQELQNITFTSADKVHARIHPTTWRQRIYALWNKEVEIRGSTAGAILLAFTLFLGIGGIRSLQTDIDMNDNRQQIKLGGSTYWKGELEKVVKLDDD